jgi:hypothetical protein
MRASAILSLLLPACLLFGQGKPLAPQQRAWLKDKVSSQFVIGNRKVRPRPDHTFRSDEKMGEDMAAITGHSMHLTIGKLLPLQNLTPG